MPEGLRRPILPGGRARGGIGNCRWVRRATPIPTEPAMGSELEPNAQLSESRGQGVSSSTSVHSSCPPLNSSGWDKTPICSEKGFPDHVLALYIPVSS